MYLTLKRKIAIGLIFILLLFMIVQYIFLKKEEPPLFVEVDPLKETAKIGIKVKDTVNEEKQDVVVDIKGEVNKPGVYQVDVNDRIQDVITIAGGVTEEADLSQVNLAMKVRDEMVIYIPKTGEKLASNPINLNMGKISINNSDINQLMMLDGIGEAKAKAIIEYRNTNGSFKTIEEIMKVPGIGAKIFAQIKDEITLN
ncbi:hypothetical protein BHF71_04000 [Vulcanibacillus modesticaldus]|uniref:Helix-hairpin-helix DNA-binding motif class 1 domain-containing protein n=1 Tax=Vulcanibacillus modesticaldus TaxID=337097 RepID=A0A1D2YS62_9BACI|nr:helix-hairpin-helix domain-containing protein [Vulcanibacillus modesticaldus]OEF96899.1 hypothetical protein BHF71_04000 [Vulcanibacillus modesticaldus]